MSPTDAATRSTQPAAASSAGPLRVKTLDHVTLVVKDLERSHAFYAGVLGMQPVERPQVFVFRQLVPGGQNADSSDS